MKSQGNGIEQTSTVAVPDCALETVLKCVAGGSFGEAVQQFNDRFTYSDNGIQLEFSEKGRLRDFFRKTREVYSDMLFELQAVRQTGDDLIGEWTLRATISEAFFGGMQRKAPILVRGASIVRVENGKISQWSDYYDGLRARRSAVSDFFTDWLEL